jgi:hypothetical protein
MEIFLHFVGKMFLNATNKVIFIFFLNTARNRKQYPEQKVTKKFGSAANRVFNKTMRVACTLQKLLKL